ncbi:hypothetical protein KJ693_05165 [bacterium]|nr:hypothetical protein [bacterium]MBU1614688.1 hypothetical protein [bacterium]
MESGRSDLSKKFWEDKRWGTEHYQDFIKKYPDMWIAVVNRKVVASSKSITEAKEKARRETKRKDIPLLFVEGSVHVY